MQPSVKVSGKNIHSMKVSLRWKTWHGRNGHLTRVFKSNTRQKRKSSTFIMRPGEVFITVTGEKEWRSSKSTPMLIFHWEIVIKLFTVNSIADLKAAKQQHVILKQWHRILHFRWMQFWGTFQGYRQSTQMLTWNLKRTFYYPNAAFHNPSQENHRVDPIQYHEESEKR